MGPDHGQLENAVTSAIFVKVGSRFQLQEYHLGPVSDHLNPNSWDRERAQNFLYEFLR